MIIACPTLNVTDSRFVGVGVVDGIVDAFFHALRWANHT